MTEPPTKIYEPHTTDRARIAVLAQSDAPMRIYQPATPPPSACQQGSKAGRSPH